MREDCRSRPGDFGDGRNEAQLVYNFALPPLVLHTLAFDLASRLPTGMVVLPGATKPLAATRSISVVFEELAAGPDPKITLDARWTLAGVTRHERVEVNIASLDSAEIASGVSQAIATLADRMATQLAR